MSKFIYWYLVTLKKSDLATIVKKSEALSPPIRYVSVLQNITPTENS